MQSNRDSHTLGLVNSEGGLLQSPLHQYAGGPAWSPDGRAVAFFGEQGISQLDGDYSLGNGIWRIDLVDREARNARRLVAIDNVKNLAWSPDGTKLAFEVHSPVANPEIWVVEALGGQVIKQFPGKQPTWTSDSEELVINTCSPSCGLWRFTFLGEPKKSLTRDSNDSYPTCSVKGDLAFSRKIDEDWEIYLLPRGEDEPRRLTNRPGSDTTPVFSPDGREIYLRTDHRARGDNWDIVAISPDGSQERMVKEGVGPSGEWGLARPAVGPASP